MACKDKETMTPRPVARSVALILITVAAGLVLRMAPLGLPAFVVKYGGSTMWAVMIDWIASAVLARWRPAAVVLISGMIATAVEFFKLYQSPGMDAFRATLAGKCCWGGTSRGGILWRIGRRSALRRGLTGAFDAWKARTHLINISSSDFCETGVAQGVSADWDGRPLGTDRRTVGIGGTDLAPGAAEDNRVAPGTTRGRC